MGYKRFAGLAWLWAASIWLSPFLWSANAPAAFGSDSPITFENALLQSRTEDILNFAVDREGRAYGVRAALTPATIILDEAEQRTHLEAGDLGSTWVIQLQYPQKGEGLPVILEMERVHRKPAE